ncbi:PorV/PorQ family protein [Elusimicrobiota bacterium]
MMKILHTIKYWISITAVSFMIAVMCSCFSSAGSVGTNRAEFLLIGVGARPSGMGEAFTAVADDVNTISYNPAGLGNIRDAQVTLMHNNWIDDIGYEYMGLAYELNNYGTAGLEVKYLHTASIMGRGINGRQTSHFSVYNLAVTAAYGKKIYKGLSIGSNIKLIQEKLEDERVSSIGFDLGGLYIMDSGLRFGLAVQNFGPETKFVKESEPLPLNLKLGTAYKMLEDSLILALDANLSEYSGSYINIGSEYCFRKIASARLGYKSDNALESNARINLGLGFGWNDYKFDYTFVPFEDLGQSHRFSLMIKFGKKKKDNKTVFRYRSPGKKITYIDGKKDAMKILVEKINTFKKLNEDEDIIIKLSNKYIYFDDIAINIEYENHEVFERLADVLIVMTEYKIELIDVSDYIKDYFMGKGISEDRIICNSGAGENYSDFEPSRTARTR